MATATGDREIWAAIESISARVAKLEGSYAHLATKADIAEVKTLIVQVEGRLDTKVEAVKVDTTRLILRVTGAVIASQLTMAGLLFTAIKLWG